MTHLFNNKSMLSSDGANKQTKTKQQICIYLNTEKLNFQMH